MYNYLVELYNCMSEFTECYHKCSLYLSSFHSLHLSQICALGCIFAATPHVFDTKGNTKVTTSVPTGNTSTEQATLPKPGWIRDSEDPSDGHSPLSPLPVEEESKEDKVEKEKHEVGEEESDTHIMVSHVQTVTSSSWSIGGSNFGQDRTKGGEEDHEETKC